MSKKGFTLIELLVVIAIIGILGSIVMTFLNSARNKGRIGAGLQFESSMYHAEGDMIVGEWNFDECTGTGIVATTALDSSGNGKNGTPTGNLGNPQWSSNTPTEKKCSMAFSGSNSIVLPDIDSTISTSVTISAWIYPTNAGDPSYEGIAGNCTGCGFFSFVRANSLMFDINTTAGRILTGRGTIVSDRWQHVALVYDGALMSWYIDGRLVGTAVQTGLITPGSTGGRIGFSGFASEFFRGSIDNVRIFAKSLSAKEVGKIYAQGLSEHPPLAKR